MGKGLGDRLIVDISVGPQEKRGVNLVDFLNENPGQITTVLSSIDENGYPHTAPIALIMAKDEKNLLVAIHKEWQTFENLERNNKVCVEIMARDDIVLGIKGKAEIFEEEMKTRESGRIMTLWNVKVDNVKQDNSPAEKVTREITKEPRSKEAKKFHSSVVEEMKGYIDK